MRLRLLHAVFRSSFYLLAVYGYALALASVG